MTFKNSCQTSVLECTSFPSTVITFLFLSDINCQLPIKQGYFSLGTSDSLISRERLRTCTHYIPLFTHAGWWNSSRDSAGCLCDSVWSQNRLLKDLLIYCVTDTFHLILVSGIHLNISQWNVIKEDSGGNMCTINPLQVITVKGKFKVERKGW